jgi:sigma-B regulation protein RsbU (phosphoserine phosphatase)
MLFHKGIKFRLLTYIITSTVVVFGLIIFHNIYISSKFLLKNVKQNAKEITISSVNKIEGVLLSVEKITQTQALLLELNNYNEESIKNILYNIVKNNKEIYGSCIAFEPYSFSEKEYLKSFYYFKSHNSVEFKDLSKKNYNYYLWDWYQIPKAINKPYWTEPYFDKDAGNIIMSTYSVPFYKKTANGKILKGIVTIDISLEWLSKLVDSIKFYKTGYAFLISQTGTIITHPTKDFIMNESIFSLADEANQPYLGKIGKEMIEGKSGFYKVVPVTTKKDSWMYYEPLPSTKWSLAVIFPENELYADLHGLFLSLILISIIGLLLLIFLIITVARNITDPVKKLARATVEIGNGNFNVKLPQINKNDEIAQLNRSINGMQIDLKKYLHNFEEQTISKEKMINELQIAHDIQVSFIPRTYPAFPHLTNIDIHGQVDTAKEVGGDLFDYFLIDNHKLCITISDVSSFGMTASLFMAFARTIIRARAQKPLILKEIIAEINKDLCTDNTKTFSLTLFIGIVNLKTGDFEYCNANHLSPLLIQENEKVAILDTYQNESLGLNYDTNFITNKITLKQNDLIVLFTDGVTEAINEDAEFYGIERLKESINFQKQREETTKIITEFLIEGVKIFVGKAEQTDDITVLTFKYKG